MSNARLQADRASAGAMDEAYGCAVRWVRAYPLHALAVALAKGIVIGLLLRR